MNATIDHDTSLEYLGGRITIHPDICNGHPTIRGMRITAETVLGFLSAGESRDEILRQYPSLELADIDACLRFASDLMSRRFVCVMSPDVALLDRCQSSVSFCTLVR